MNCELDDLRQGWTWSDGTMVKYHNWHDKQPSWVDERKCGSVLRSTQKWHNLACTLILPYICELEVTRITGKKYNL